MSELKNNDIDAEALLIQDPTVEMLKEESRKLNIDLLIMGSHRHSWLYEKFIGHSANKLIGHLNIPLLIVPIPKE
jgi:nucleotide-binding universal stress UspA family protein